MEPTQLGMNPLVVSWLDKELPSSVTTEQREIVKAMLGWLLPPLADYTSRNCKQFVKISPMLMLYSMLRLFGNVLDELRFVNV